MDKNRQDKMYLHMGLQGSNLMINRYKTRKIMINSPNLQHFLLDTIQRITLLGQKVYKTIEFGRVRN